MTQPEYTITDSPPHINPDTYEWDRQLPNPGLVAQLDPPTAPEPTLQPKIFDRLAWADGVVRARRYRGPTAAVFHRQTVRAATEAGCFESVDNMASGLGISGRSVQRAIRTISTDGYMTVEERHGQTYLCRPDFTKGVTVCHPPGGDCVSPKGKPSSSKLKEIKERSLVDNKEGSSSESKPGATGSFSLSEEEKTGATVPASLCTTEDAKAFVDQTSEIPTDSEIEPLGKHTWEAWGPHWGGGWTAAWATWTKDSASRKKFRTDAVAHLVKVGLPKPQPADPDNERARKVATEDMDRRIAENAQSPKTVMCAGCNQLRQLKPGVTHCYSCRKRGPGSSNTPPPANGIETALGTGPQQRDY